VDVHFAFGWSGIAGERLHAALRWVILVVAIIVGILALL
jgi:hypothetical protein